MFSAGAAEPGSVQLSGGSEWLEANAGRRFPRNWVSERLSNLSCRVFPAVFGNKAARLGEPEADRVDRQRSGPDHAEGGVGQQQDAFGVQVAAEQAGQEERDLLEAKGLAGCHGLPPRIVVLAGSVARLGVRRPVGYLRVCSLAEGGCVAWMLRLVKIGAEGEGPCTDIMEISRPDDLVDIANLGLTLAEAKRLLAGVQREIVAAQARTHAVRRPECPRCDGVCRVKDYRDHAVATLFGEVTVRLPRFRCAACGGIEAGVGWPPHCRSTPELDRLQVISAP